ncbi:MAG: tetratricopeptide (TPR) repeat protein [Flavobacteriales bacterium]
MIDKGDSLFKEGDLQGAYIQYEKHRLLKESRKDTEHLANVFNKLGIVKDQLEQYEESRRFFLMAKSYSNLSGDSAELGDSFNNLACSYYFTGVFDSAFLYFDSTAKVFSEIGDLKRLSIIEFNRGSMMIQRGDNEGAIKQYKSSIQSNSSLKDTVLGIVASLNLGVAYLNVETNDSSLFYLQESESLAKLYWYPEHLKSILNNLGHLHYNMGEFEKACDYYESYHDLKDSLYSASTALSIAQLEQESSLAKEKLALKEAELETAIWQRWVIAIAALFVIGLLTVFGIYKRRKAIQKVKTQAILQTREEENKRITDLLWKEIGDSTKGGKLSLPGQELPENAIPGAIAAVRFLSNQQFNPYLQLGLTKAVDNLIDVLSKGKGISIQRELEDIVIDKQDRLIYYRIIENILVEVFSRLNTSDVKIELNIQKSNLHFQAEADEVMDKNQLRFQSAEARIQQLNGKLKFDLSAHSSKLKVVIPLPKV